MSPACSPQSSAAHNPAHAAMCTSMLYGQGVAATSAETCAAVRNCAGYRALSRRGELCNPTLYLLALDRVQRVAAEHRVITKAVGVAAAVQTGPALCDSQRASWALGRACSRAMPLPVRGR